MASSKLRIPIGIFNPHTGAVHRPDCYMIQESLFIIPIYDWDSEEGYRALHAHPPSVGKRFCKLCKPYIPGVTRRGKKVKKEVTRQPGRKARSDQAEKGRGMASRPKAAKKKILITDEDRA